MNRFEKGGLTFISLAMVVFIGLWTLGNIEKNELRRDLQRVRDEVEVKQAKLNGMEQANQRLQKRLQEIPVLTFTSELPDLSDVPQSSSRNRSVSALNFEEEDLEMLSSDEEETPSAEDQAEQAAREEAAAERRAEREQRREEWRTSMNKELEDRRAFFSMINTEGLSPEYAESNQRLIDVMGEMQLKLQEMANPDLDRNERRELGRSMWQASREIRDLMELQKDVLLYDYAELELGLPEEQKQAFIDYMRTIDRYTNLPRGGGRGGR